MKYQVAIIGGGPAGYTAPETAGKAGLSVVLFEKRNLGGVCLNEGCIPTKTLLYSAKTYDNACHASKYAVSVSEVSFDLSKIIARKQKVVRKLVLGVKGKLTANNVTIVNGVTIGDGAVIGANSIVTKDIPPYSIYGGVPAKCIRMRFEQNQIDFLLKLKWWNMDEEWIRSNSLLFSDVNCLMEKYGISL